MRLRNPSFSPYRRAMTPRLFLTKPKSMERKWYRAGCHDTSNFQEHKTKTKHYTESCHKPTMPRGMEVLPRDADCRTSTREVASSTSHPKFPKQGSLYTRR